MALGMGPSVKHVLGVQWSYVVPEKRLFFWKLEQIQVEEYHPRCGYNKNCRSFQRILQY